EPMLMTILRPLINPTRRIAVPAVASIMITFSAVGGAAADRPDSFADQVEQLSPAVVNISTTTIVSE
ncbi:MAG TPA: serine protease, partial [Alphaproteobacteria bacterium]|nr:serine protease [Alphaproteobacteria bacterium]